MKVWCARWTLAAVVVLMSASVAGAGPWTFSLDPPGGAIAGAPGEIIGWGYSVTNESETDWLVLSGISADPFAHATADASLFAFPIIAPGATLAVAYDAIAAEGLFQIVWNASAPIGFTSSGTFILSGETWDNDPTLGGNFVSLTLDQSAAYSATVSAGDIAPVPEPGTLLLVASGITGLWWRRRAGRFAAGACESTTRHQEID